MTRKDVSSLAIVVLIGLVLQVGLIFLDCSHSSPSETAVRYIEAYYKLSPSMSEWLCTSAAQTPEADLLYNATEAATERGFDKHATRYTLSHIKTRTQYLDETTAVVHLTAHRRLAINPFYAWVARLFQMGETHGVDESIRVTLENGHWRVCIASS